MYTEGKEWEERKQPYTYNEIDNTIVYLTCDPESHDSKFVDKSLELPVASGSSLSASRSSMVVV